MYRPEVPFSRILSCVHPSLYPDSIRYYSILFYSLFYSLLYSLLYISVRFYGFQSATTAPHVSQIHTLP